MKNSAWDPIRSLYSMLGPLRPMFWTSNALILGQSLWMGVILTSMAAFFQTLAEGGVFSTGFDPNSPIAKVQVLFQGLPPEDRAAYGFAATAGAIFLGSLIQLGVFAYTSLLQTRFMCRLRDGLFLTLLRGRVPYLDAHKKGKLLQILVPEVRGCYAVIKTGQKILVDFLHALVYAAFIAVLSWQLGALVLATGLLLALASRWIGKRIKAASERSLKSRSELMTVAEETLGGLRPVKLLNLYRSVMRRFEGADHEAEFANRTATLYAQSQHALASFASLVAMFVLITLNFRYALLPTATLIIFLYVLSRLATHLASLNQSYGTFISYVPSIEKTLVLNQSARSEAETSGDAKPVPLIQDAVRYEKVGLDYPERPKAVRGATFTLRRGETVALVGPSGSGKTSLANLLVGLFRPTEGNLTLDGRPIEQIDLEHLRSRVGIVTQDVFVFGATARENLLMARPDASNEDIERAARDANADEFLRTLPDGYDTLLGERGVNLSGGQKQRLNIAQVLLKDPEILILDEATSALDSESERLIQEALGRLRAGRTTLVIAHRLSTVRDADRIVVLDQGRVVEQGTWNELTARQSRFKAMVELQN